MGSWVQKPYCMSLMSWVILETDSILGLLPNLRGCYYYELRFRVGLPWRAKTQWVCWERLQLLSLFSLSGSCVALLSNVYMPFEYSSLKNGTTGFLNGNCAQYLIFDTLAIHLFLLSMILFVYCCQIYSIVVLFLWCRYFINTYQWMDIPIEIYAPVFQSSHHVFPNWEQENHCQALFTQLECVCRKHKKDSSCHHWLPFLSYTQPSLPSVYYSISIKSNSTASSHWIHLLDHHASSS